MSKGKLVVISGFSGAGKGTIVKQLIERYGYSLSVSATTRAPREGEVDGKDYYFKTTDEFLSLVDYNGLIEWTKKGAANIKAQYPDAVLLFLTTKDVETLRGRLRKRGTETDEVIEKRIKRAAEESELMDNYDYIVVNDDLEECIDTVHSIIISDYYKTENMAEFIKTIREDLADE